MCGLSMLHVLIEVLKINSEGETYGVCEKNQLKQD